LKDFDLPLQVSARFQELLSQTFASFGHALARAGALAPLRLAEIALARVRPSARIVAKDFAQFVDDVRPDPLAPPRKGFAGGPGRTFLFPSRTHPRNFKLVRPFNFRLRHAVECRRTTLKNSLFDRCKKLLVRPLRPSRFALGFAAVLVGMLASVAKWPWPAQVAALVVLAALMIPAGAASSAGLKARPPLIGKTANSGPFGAAKPGAEGPINLSLTISVLTPLTSAPRRRAGRAGYRAARCRAGFRGAGPVP
jgi:hypothetical protein